MGLPRQRAREYRPRSPSQMPAKHAAKPSGHVIGPPKSDNADEIVAASSEIKLSKTIAVEARSACAIMIQAYKSSSPPRIEERTKVRSREFAAAQICRKTLTSILSHRER